MDMKKRVKRICLSLLMVMILAVMTACGSSKTTESESDKASQTESKDSADSGSEEVSDTLKKLREKGVLTVGSSGDVYAYIDEDTGEFSGIDAVIIKEVAKRLGIDKVEMSLIPFSELILNLNSGNIDMITDGMYIRSDRAKQVHFGEVWYTQGGGLVVPEDSNIKSADDFDPSSTTVGYTAGTVYLTAGTTLYVYVGEAGKYSTAVMNDSDGSWNGGGYRTNSTACGSSTGGGASDIRLTGGAWNNAT